MLPFTLEHSLPAAGNALSRSWGPSVLTRLPRCTPLQDATAFIFCREDRAVLCRRCDFSIHSANKLAEKHERCGLLTLRLHPPYVGSWDEGPPVVAAWLQSLAGSFPLCKPPPSWGSSKWLDYSCRRTVASLLRQVAYHLVHLTQFVTCLPAQAVCVRTRTTPLLLVWRHVAR